MHYIMMLRELGRSDLPIAGGKGANLGELIRAGLPVPAGFCVTTAGYLAFIEANAIEEPIRGALSSARVEDPLSLEDSSARIRALFKAGSLPPNIAEEIRHAYAGLGDAGAAVAVRSSATAEDLPDLSFAGQQDTYLNIQGEVHVLHAVVDCWASLWTARAIGYRARAGVPDAGLALAVVVQIMVQSEASGVLFTANPLTGRRSETAIDATIGLGEALVSGRVEPDHYTVEGGLIKAKTLGAKALSIRGRSGGGTLTLSENTAGRQALADDGILALAELGARAERYFGTPQDMEWAWDGNRLFVVQSRPITSLYPLPAIVRPDETLALFSLGSVQGMLDPFTPLGLDGFKLVAKGLAGLFGMKRTQRTQRALVEAGGRLFLNFTPLLRNRMGRIFPRVFVSSIDPGTKGALESLLGDPRFAIGRKGMKAGTFLGFLRILIRLLSIVIPNLISPVRGRMRLNGGLDDFVRQAAALYRSASTLAERIAAMESMLARLPALFVTRLIPAVACGQAPLQLLGRLCREVPGIERTLLEITRGLAHNVTTEMDLALWRTARAIMADAVAGPHLAGTAAEELAAEFLAGRLPAAAQDLISRFMERYGMRGVGEIDMGRARWKERPISIMQSLKSYSMIRDESLSPEAVFARGAASAVSAGEDLVRKVRALPGGRLKAVLARGLIRRIRELMGLRESPKFTAIRAMTIIRDGMLESGRELTARGILDDADDIFFLCLDDIKILASGRDADWKAMVLERRQAYDREKRRRMVPRVLLSDGTAFYGGVGPAEGEGTGGGSGNPAVLLGSPVSPGVAEGPVCIVFDPAGAQLAPGEILVCPGTDPAWTPLFLTAGGLVMEVGGMMTHGSVVAREYGIPAVVGVERATFRLKTGQRIRMDGATGRIEILD